VCVFESVGLSVMVIGYRNAVYLSKLKINGIASKPQSLKIGAVGLNRYRSPAAIFGAFSKKAEKR
jgi:hypothetical protein